jgi:hypothetical protein
MQTTWLYRPVNQTELDLIAASGWQRFPPRLPEQPVFYPVMNEAYAIEITREWNVPAYGVGYVTRFAVQSEFLKRYKVENVGAAHFNELWVPAEEMDLFNDHLVGPIEVTHTFRAV